MQAYMTSAANHLPRMISMSRTGEVASNSIVPDRFSSANSRMVIIGIRNNPMTLTFISSGRTIHSFKSIGMPRPIICDSMPRVTKIAVAM